MSDVYEIYSHEWNSETEVIYVEAEVSDSILTHRATLYEPEQWTHGRCYTSFIWPLHSDDPITKESVFEYVNDNDAIEWTLMPEACGII
tara:strand:+ start:53 stop:319 length:267 start_codon:yes stop_codon:yes gene_type:complete